MNIQPLSNNVLVELLKEDQKTTKSGIVLPDNVEKKEQTKGMVVSVGQGKVNDKGERTPMSVKVGDKVLFSKPWSDDKKIEEEDDAAGGEGQTWATPLIQAVVGEGVSQQALGSLRTRRWPVRYTQDALFSSLMFWRPTMASPARIGGPWLIRRIR